MKTIIIILVALVMVAGGTLYLSTIAMPSPIEDCAILDVQPDKNYDKWGLAIGKWNGYTYRTLIKFDLSQIDVEDLESVEIRLYGAIIPEVSDTANIYVYLVGNWNEKTVTWNNQPPIVTYHFGDKAYSKIGERLDIDNSELGWISIEIDKEFFEEYIKAKYKVLRIILIGDETEENSYFYAQDSEYKRGKYAPQLVLMYRKRYGELKCTTYTNGEKIDIPINIKGYGQIPSGETIKLKLGSYNISCTYKGETLKKTIVIEEGLNEVTFNFETEEQEEEKATLTVKTYYEDEEVNTIVTINNVEYVSPITLELPWGEYEVIGEYLSLIHI